MSEPIKRLKWETERWMPKYQLIINKNVFGG